MNLNKKKNSETNYPGTNLVHIMHSAQYWLRYCVLLLFRSGCTQSSETEGFDIHTDEKSLTNLEKARESASAPALEAAVPETSHRSSVSSKSLPHIHLCCKSERFDQIQMWAYSSRISFISTALYIIQNDSKH